MISKQAYHHKSGSVADTMKRQLHGATSRNQKSQTIHARPAQPNLAMVQQTLVRPTANSTAFPREQKKNLKITFRKMPILTQIELETNFLDSRPKHTCSMTGLS